MPAKRARAADPERARGRKHGNGCRNPGRHARQREQQPSPLPLPVRVDDRESGLRRRDCVGRHGGPEQAKCRRRRPAVRRRDCVPKRVEIDAFSVQGYRDQFVPLVGCHVRLQAVTSSAAGPDGSTQGSQVLAQVCSRPEQPAPNGLDRATAFGRDLRVAQSANLLQQEDVTVVCSKPAQRLGESEGEHLVGARRRLDCGLRNGSQRVKAPGPQGRTPALCRRQRHQRSPAGSSQVRWQGRSG